MIEQTAILCGMVKTPNPQPATGEIAAYAEYHPHFSAERKELIVGIKRERRPSRRLRMHIVLLASEGHRPARIARVL